jgi:ribosomal protein L7/L12
METQLLLIIGGVIVVVVLVVYWQRQGVVKRPSVTDDPDLVVANLTDWLSGEDAPSLSSDWADGIGLSQEQVAQINAEIGARRKINAIKLYREYTGQGLKEAKDAVEAIERGQSPIFSGYASATANEPVGDVMTQIEQELRAKRKINAVKLYREAYNVGLKEAKDAVDEMERKLRM